MARDAKIMSAAYRQFRQDRDQRQRELERREAEVYRRLPRVESIDRELRGTAAKIVLAAFEQGGDFVGGASFAQARYTARIAGATFGEYEAADATFVVYVKINLA